jgi:hypothetical protein
MGEMDTRGDPLRALKPGDRWGMPDEQAKMDLAELVRLRANLLAPDERTLLEAYLKGSNSVRQIARLSGMKPSSAWRKVRRIIKRLVASAELFCLEGPCGLSVDELAIAKDHLVRGLSLWDISRARKLTYYRTRNIILKAKAVARANRERGTPKRRHQPRIPSLPERTFKNRSTL